MASGFLRDIDAAVTSGQYERAVALGYTCLEGFFKAFVAEKSPATDLTESSRCLSRYSFLVPSCPSLCGMSAMT